MANDTTIISLLSMLCVSVIIIIIVIDIIAEWLMSKDDDWHLSIYPYERGCKLILMQTNSYINTYRINETKQKSIKRQVRNISGESIWHVQIVVQYVLYDGEKY